MAKGLLRNIAVSIGAGLAVGFGGRLVARRARRSTPNLSPILTRLEEIESRVDRVEHTPSIASPGTPEEIQALGTLVSSQSEDITGIREELLRIERRNAEQVESFGQKVALLEQQVPVHIEASVTARMAELEQRLRGEFHEIHYRTVDAFADTIEKRVVGRITALENSLIEQSHSITSLREKSTKTDENLNRLLDAVEKLCARAEAQSQIALVRMESEAPAPAIPPVSQELIAQPPIAPENKPEQIKPEPQLDWQQPEVTVAEEPIPEPETVHSSRNGFGPSSDSSTRRGLKPVGMAILGLAILGFRLIR